MALGFVTRLLDWRVIRYPCSHDVGKELPSLADLYSRLSIYVQQNRSGMPGGTERSLARPEARHQE